MPSVNPRSYRHVVDSRDNRRRRVKFHNELSVTDARQPSWRNQVLLIERGRYIEGRKMFGIHQIRIDINLNLAYFTAVRQWHRRSLHIRKPWPDE